MEFSLVLAIHCTIIVAHVHCLAGQVLYFVNTNTITLRQNPDTSPTVPGNIKSSIHNQPFYGGGEPNQFCEIHHTNFSHFLQK
jgi:hypothetical protein